MGRRLASLPAEIGQLTALTELHLSGCSKLASLPAEIGQLTGLKMLDLNGCPQLESLLASQDKGEESLWART